MFSTCLESFLPFSINLKLLSAICFSLDQSKILSSGNGLMLIVLYNTLYFCPIFSLQTRAAYKKAMEDNGVSDPAAMDKNYWIQRVGEVGHVGPMENWPNLLL